MPQHIGVQRVREDGSIQEDFNNLNAAAVLDILYKLPNGLTEFKWLSSIDPYGLTYINSIQKESFVKELQELSLRTDSDHHKKQISGLINAILETGTHLYIKLIGD
jgi:hypothetical protein